MAGTDSARRAKAYFDRPAWRRIRQAVWSRYASLGRVGGNAVVSSLTEAESEALNSFFGWNHKPGDTGIIPLALFDEELRVSGFAPMNIVQLHALVEGGPLLTKEERKLLADERWRKLFDVVRGKAEEPLCKAADEWLSRLEAGTGAGSRTLRDLYKEAPEIMRTSIEIVVHTLHLLFPDDGSAAVPIRLPVLAARVSGDAHALDRNQPAGRMLAAVLRERLTGSEELGEDAEGLPALDDGSESLKLRETYRSFGILDDDLSSIVHWYVPVPNEPALPSVWTLRQVEAAARMPCCSRIYAVENPAVFSTLLDSMPERFKSDDQPPALICTSGPASAAAIRWMERCMAASGEACMLYYSGDFDVKGLSMGQTLAGRFPGRFVPWRFDADTYALAIMKRQGPPFDESDLIKLTKMNAPWDERLCAAMIRGGCKIHHESVVEALVDDMWFGGRD